MALDDNDIYRIQSIFREELEHHFSVFKLYIEEQYQSKLSTNEKFNIFKEKYVDPLTLKVYSFGATVSGVIIVLGIVLKIKGAF